MMAEWTKFQNRKYSNPYMAWIYFMHDYIYMAYIHRMLKYLTNKYWKYIKKIYI